MGAQHFSEIHPLNGFMELTGGMRACSASLLMFCDVCACAPVTSACAPLPTRGTDRGIQEACFVVTLIMVDPLSSWAHLVAGLDLWYAGGRSLALQRSPASMCKFWQVCVHDLFPWSGWIEGMEPHAEGVELQLPALGYSLHAGPGWSCCRVRWD